MNLGFDAEPKDGDQAADTSGNVYVYDSNNDTWNKIGVAIEVDEVSDTKNGLVTPAIYEKLLYIKSLKNDGVDLTKTKLFIGDHPDNPYFYFITSTDDLMEFRPETLVSGKKRLRLELNRGRLFQHLTRTPCIGPIGPRGVKGDAGEDGEEATPEIFRRPITVQVDHMTISAPVTAPLSEAISIRVFRLDEQVLEIAVPLDGSALTSSGELKIDTAKTTIKFSANKVTGTIFLSSGQFSTEPNTWFYKARQRGPRGERGNDGLSFLELIEEPIDDPLLSVESVIATLRVSQEKNLTYVKQVVKGQVIASSLTLKPNQFPTETDPEKQAFLAVNYSTAPSKEIGFYKTEASASASVQLELPDWTPLKACQTRRRFAMSEFRWMDQIDLGSGSIGCFGIEIPFNILTDPAPPNLCCRDDFFLCANKGDRCSVAVGDGIVSPNRP